MKNMYFAHPVNIYNTPFEAELMEVIHSFFPEWHIENPNQQKHQDGYKRAGMNYYTQEVLPSMDGLTGLCFPDGKFGAGVYAEGKNLFEQKKGIWTITPQKTLSSVKDIADWIALSVEDTRQRIYIGGKRENGMKGFFD